MTPFVTVISLETKSLVVIEEVNVKVSVSSLVESPLFTTVLLELTAEIVIVGAGGGD